MKKALKEEAILLRKSGWSYTVISQKIGINKGTLSNWLRNIPYEPNPQMKVLMRKGTTKSVEVRMQQKRDSIQSAHKLATKEVALLTKRDLFMIGLGLYIGEGQKASETVRIINSDPLVIKLAIKWLREVCDLTTQNFTIAIHLYPDIPIEEALEFWSSIANVPISQFGKTQIDRRINKSELKKGKSPYGTAHVTIRSCGNKNHGVFLHRRIMGWIETIYNQHAGIV